MKTPTHDYRVALLTLVLLAGSIGLQPASAFQNGSTVASQRRHIYAVGGDVKPPEPISSPGPSQLPGEMGKKIQRKAKVVLMVTVETDGSIGNIRLQKSKGADLDAVAIETVKTWRFKPATKNGVPVPVDILAEVNFKP